MVFVDLEKAYDRIPRDLIWWSLRKRGFEDHYITVIRDMYERTKSKVRTLTGSTKEFQIDVGLHQGAALSPFPFTVVLYVLTESIGTDPPNAMLFADDLVICEDTRDKAEYQLERWRDVLERHGLNVSWQKTEYMSPSNTNDAVKKYYVRIHSSILAPSLRLREGQKQIARTECECHGINGEKRRVSFATRKCQ